ncbi:hypothetical protein ACQCT5_02590 [Sutcliffiella halmapala]
MNKPHLNLMQFFEGFVKNYRKLNLNTLHNRSMFTQREINYFVDLGEMLGFDSFVEDSKFDKLKNRSRPMDLSWWKWDLRVDPENYDYLALHLERESLWSKDEETIEKLFSETDEGFIPKDVVGILYVESVNRISFLNQLILEKNKKQKSNVLMIYRFNDESLGVERVWAYHFVVNGIEGVRKAICKQDEFGYYNMCFEEEFHPLSNNIEEDIKSKFDWENSSEFFETKMIRNRVNADKLFVSLLKRIEENELDYRKSYSIKEIADIIPRGTAGISNYATYGFSLMSMFSSQKNRDYFIFEDNNLRTKITSICNDTYNRDNYYWKKHLLDVKVIINPKYIKK